MLQTGAMSTIEMSNLDRKTVSNAPISLGCTAWFSRCGFGIWTGVLVKSLGPMSKLLQFCLPILFSLPILFYLQSMFVGGNFEDKSASGYDFRVIFGCLGITFWFLSLRHIPLGIATALFQSSVIFITLMSPIFL